MTSTLPLEIGTRGNEGPFQDYFFNGLIDEVRVSSIARSASWIATEYNNQASPSAFYTVSNQQSNAVSSSVVVSCSPNPVVAGSSVTCTATVSGYSPTGTVTWSSNSALGSFSSQNPLTLGSATATFTDPKQGTVIITATYSGDISNTPSAGSITLTINVGGVSSITVSPAASSLTSGNSITFTATPYDAFGNSWDITSLVNWGVTSGAGGSWSGNTYTSSNIGSWIATADYSGVEGTAQITVTAPPIIVESITPSQSFVEAGFTTKLTAAVENTGSSAAALN